MNPIPRAWSVVKEELVGVVGRGAAAAPTTASAAMVKWDSGAILFSLVCW